MSGLDPDQSIVRVLSDGDQSLQGQPLGPATPITKLVGFEDPASPTSISANFGYAGQTRMVHHGMALLGEHNVGTDDLRRRLEVYWWV